MIFVAIALFLSNLVSFTVAEDAEESLNVATERCCQAGIIAHWGYPVERHDVRTADGYILDLYRIPHGRRKNCSSESVRRPAIVFNHGLFSCATQFVLNLPHQSAGFVFADAGFDVYLMNQRGTTYGRRHVNLSAADAKFWMFTMDEMIKYDFPAVIDAVLKISGQEQLYYVGHSQATIIGFGALAEHPEYNRKVREAYHWGAINTRVHGRGLVRFARALYTPLRPLADLYTSFYGSHEIGLPLPLLLKPLARLLCSDGSPLAFVCSSLLYLASGPYRGGLNMSRVPVYLSHYPAGSSTMNLLHWGQVLAEGDVFRKYSYHNMFEHYKHYRQFTQLPPAYDYRKITTPQILFWSTNDWAVDSDENDAQNLSDQFSPGVVDQIYHLPSFEHTSFAVSLHAERLVYRPMIERIARLEQLDTCSIDQ